MHQLSMRTNVAQVQTVFDLIESRALIGVVDGEQVTVNDDFADIIKLLIPA